MTDAALTPTPNDCPLPRRRSDFSTFNEAIDYAAQSEKGLNFHDMRGTLMRPYPFSEMREDALQMARRILFADVTRQATVLAYNHVFQVVAFTFAVVLPVVWLLRRKLGHLSGRQFLSGAWRVLVAAAFMTAAVWFLLSLIEADAVWLQLIAGAVVGGAVYFLASLLLRVPELQQLIAIGRQRLAR